MSHTQSKRAGLVGNRCHTPGWTLGDVIDFEEAEQRALAKPRWRKRIA